MSYQDADDKRCCGKKRYKTRAKAEAAMRKWQEIRGVSGPRRCYRCPNGYYHLTHMPKSQYNQIRRTRDGQSPEEAERIRDRMRAIIARDEGLCVICGRRGEVLMVADRVIRHSANEKDLSTYITVHYECRYDQRLSNDILFENGWRLDSHMSRDAHRYPVHYIRSDGSFWAYLGQDGSLRRERHVESRSRDQNEYRAS